MIRLRRAPDFIILQQGKPYIRRWWILPRNRLFNIYLHQILRSDDDRALHDHPWWNLSIILKGQYLEVRPVIGDLHPGKLCLPGSFTLRRPTAAHRLLNNEPCWSLFITGPRIREWGFHCPQGWRHWREFLGIPTGNAKGDEIGPGCGEQ